MSAAASADAGVPEQTSAHERYLERARNRDEPSRTKSIRQRYAQKLRGRLADIRSALRTGIVENDALGLQTEALVDAPTTRQFEFTTDPQKVDAAQRWLEKQLENEVLTEYGGENQYIERSYLKGLEDAQRELGALNVGSGEAAAGASMRMPVHQEQLEQLYSRNLEELRGLTDDIARDVRRELTDGLASGDGPRNIARGVSDVLGKVEDGTPRAAMNRATMISRTELMNSHNWGRLKEWERAGVKKVDVLLANDACPQCQAYAAGAPYEASEAYGNLPQHPNCRCTHTVWTGD
jgi:SPP1 gp7 family putative phage head morphogenesis protein